MTADTIQFSPLVPWPLIAAFAVVGLGLVGVGAWRRARGTLFRLLFLGVLVLALSDPRVIREQREPQKDIALVIVDRTSSQRTGDRLAQADEAEEALVARLGRLENLDVRTVEVTDSGERERPGTRLYEALIAGAAEIPRRRFAGAVVVTDGQVHDLPETPAKGGARSLPSGPVHVLLTGRRDEIDRRLVIAGAPGYGIVGKEVAVTYRVEDRKPRHLAAPGRPMAKVEFRIDGKARSPALVPVGVDQTFKFSLDHAGPALLEIEVEPAAKELSRVNNRALVSINGVRDRLRVLLVSGQPHAAERTWRNLLKSDPSVDLVHFTILRPPDKDDFTPLNELALIAFPTQELFVERLHEFDLIVFDRYFKRGVLQSEHMANIARHVKEGGALLMAVGPEFAGRNSLYNTPLREILPAVPSGDVIQTGFLPEVSALGSRHPVTAPLIHHVGEAPGWGRWFRQVDATATGGATLMTGPGDRPLLLLDRVGKGRVAQVLSDQIWLWARGYDGGGPQGELMRRLAHWLMREPDLEEERLSAQARGRRLVVERRSLKGDTVRARITSPSGVEQEIELAPAGPGLSKAELPAGEIGLYKVEDGIYTAYVAVGETNPLELSDLRATAEPVRPLAAATGGSVRWLNDGLPDVRRVAPGRDRSGKGWIGLVDNRTYVVTGLKDVPLLPGLLLVVLALGTLMAAWWREGR